MVEQVSRFLNDNSLLALKKHIDFSQPKKDQSTIKKIRSFQLPISKYGQIMKVIKVTRDFKGSVNIL